MLVSTAEPCHSHRRTVNDVVDLNMSTVDGCSLTLSPRLPTLTFDAIRHICSFLGLGELRVLHVSIPAFHRSRLIQRIAQDRTVVGGVPQLQRRGANYRWLKAAKSTVPISYRYRQLKRRRTDTLDRARAHGPDEVGIVKLRRTGGRVKEVVMFRYEAKFERDSGVPETDVR
eukprot:88145-Amorphochlora_amoeboformis.AAC.2